MSILSPSGKFLSSARLEEVVVNLLIVFSDKLQKFFLRFKDFRAVDGGDLRFGNSVSNLCATGLSSRGMMAFYFIYCCFEVKFYRMTPFKSGRKSPFFFIYKPDRNIYRKDEDPSTG